MKSSRDKLEELLNYKWDSKIDDYKKAPVSNVDAISLVGRSLSVVSEILDGVSKDNDRAKGITGKLALVGKMLIGMARILTPDSIEGSLYQNGITVMALLDVVLLIFATFNPEFATPAFVLLGWTLGVGLFMWVVHNITRTQSPLSRWTRIVCAVLIAGIGSIAIVLLKHADQILLAKQVAQSHPGNVRQLWAQYGPMGLSAALLIVAACIWTQIASRGAKNRGVNPALQVLATCAPGLLALGALWIVPITIDADRIQRTWPLTAGFAATVLGLTLLLDIMGYYALRFLNRPRKTPTQTAGKTVTATTSGSPETISTSGKPASPFKR